MKMKVTSGTEGVASGVEEHVVNLNVGLLLRDLLEAEGAVVVMTREDADVDISNVERAVLFNDHMLDLGIRLHCNGDDDRELRGAFMLVPAENPYKEDCDRAAEVILQAYTDYTGLKNRGITERGDQTGFNWCDRPIINIEMGHMSNPEEDLLLTDPDFQHDMAQGLNIGILRYFADE
jgi:N-acetylmuramoyl-L-alanine amidase